MYEGYGPNGVALLIECLTDNRNRAAAEVRTSMSRNGGTMADPGSRRLQLQPQGRHPGREDRRPHRGRRARRGARRGRRGRRRPRRRVRGRHRPVRPRRRAHGAAGGGHRLRVRGQRVRARASRSRSTTSTSRKKVLRLVDALEDSDDVQNVYANFDLSDERRRRARRGRVGPRAGARRRPGPDPLRRRRRRRRAEPHARGSCTSRCCARRPTRRSSCGCSRIGRGLAALLDEHRPDAFALERVFAQQNVQQRHGRRPDQRRSRCTSRPSAGCPSGCTRPSEVKAAVTGYGNADKRQVTTMVTRLLGLESAPKPADAADALAIAICHAWRTGPASPAVGRADAGAARVARRGGPLRPPLTQEHRRGDGYWSVGERGLSCRRIGSS